MISKFKGIAVLLFIGLVIGVGFYFRGQSLKLDGTVDAVRVAGYSADQQTQDSQSISHKDYNDRNLRPALVRQAVVQAPGARKIIFEELTSPQSQLKLMSAQLLGYYEDDQAVEKLFELCKDSDPQIRRNAIDGMGLRSSSKRSELLGRMRLDSKMSEPDRLRARLNYYRLLKDDKEREPEFQVLLDFVKTAKAELPLQLEIIRMISQISRKNEKLVHWIEYELNFLVKNNFKSGRDEGFGSELFRSLKMVCPKERLRFFSAALKSPNVSINFKRSLIQELPYHKDLALSEQWLNDFKFSEELKPSIEQAKHSFQTLTFPKPCAAQTPNR